MQVRTAAVPEGLLPMWSHWQLPSGRLRAVYAVAEFGAGTRDGLWLGSGKLLEVAWQQNPEQLKDLRYLALEQHRILPSTLDVIGKLASLQRLYLTRVTAADLEFLKGLTNLQYLCVESLSKVTDEAAFTKLDKLVSLGLGTALATLEPLVHSYPNLRCLVLHGPSETKPARFHELDAISELEKLEHLALLNCRTPDKRLTPLLALPNLKTVALGSRRYWHSSDIKNLESAGIQVSDFVEVDYR